MQNAIMNRIYEGIVVKLKQRHLIAKPNTTWEALRMPSLVDGSLHLDKWDNLFVSYHHSNRYGWMLVLNFYSPSLSQQALRLTDLRA